MTPELEQQMLAAIETVIDQLKEMSDPELMAEDLEWSLDGSHGWHFFVEALRVDGPGRDIEFNVVCNASRGLFHRQLSLARTISVRRR